jgi:hypothetical protein
MNNSFRIRMSAISAVMSLVAFAGTAAAGHLPPPLGVGEQPLSAGVHVLDLVSREQGRSGYKHLPRITVTLPSGWFNYNGWGINDDGALSVSFWDVDKVYPTGCRWQGKPKIDPGRTVDGLARVLATRPLRHASRPTDVKFAGFRGEYLRWSVPSGIDFRRRCSQGYFESWTGRGWARDRWQQGAGQVDRLWILDLNGKRLVIDANYLPQATRPQRTELDHIVHSIKFLSCAPRKTARRRPVRRPRQREHVGLEQEVTGEVGADSGTTRPSSSRSITAVPVVIVVTKSSGGGGFEGRYGRRRTADGLRTGRRLRGEADPPPRS